MNNRPFKIGERVKLCMTFDEWKAWRKGRSGIGADIYPGYLESEMTVYSYPYGSLPDYLFLHISNGQQHIRYQAPLNRIRRYNRAFLLAEKRMRNEETV